MNTVCVPVALIGAGLVVGTVRSVFESFPRTDLAPGAAAAIGFGVVLGTVASYYW